LPPIFYILTLQILEDYLQKRETAFLEIFIIKNLDALYKGTYSVADEIRQNLGTYFKKDMKYRLGVRTNILVKTGNDRILYPVRSKDGQGILQNAAFDDQSEESLNYVELAAENYRILNEGIIISTNLRIKSNSWISNSILVFYVFLSLLVLSKRIGKALDETEKAAEEKQRLVKRYSDKLMHTEERLEEVKKKESEDQRRINELKKEKKSLSDDVNDLLGEIEELEAGLEGQKGLKQELEFEVLRLEDDLAKFRAKKEKPKKRRKKLEAMSKRFSMLYRNLSFSDRAIEGFFTLPGEFQLKTEEIIHKLNAGGKEVDIKRKVFGKGGKMDILEIEFSYSGRVYCLKESVSKKMKIIAIGTKNTQVRDMKFMESYIRLSKAK
jgi:hypothetical protein